MLQLFAFHLELIANKRMNGWMDTGHQRCCIFTRSASHAGEAEYSFKFLSASVCLYVACAIAQ